MTDTLESLRAEYDALAARGLSLDPTRGKPSAAQLDLANGLLDIALVQATGPFGWLGVWRKVWWDNSVLRRTRAGRRVLERRGRSTSVRYISGVAAEAATPIPQPVQLDGDEFGHATRISVRVEHGALLVTLPKGHVDLDRE